MGCDGRGYDGRQTATTVVAAVTKEQGLGGDRRIQAAGEGMLCTRDIVLVQRVVVLVAQHRRLRQREQSCQQPGNDA